VEVAAAAVTRGFNILLFRDAGGNSGLDDIPECVQQVWAGPAAAGSHGHKMQLLYLD
jgi:hypothetical protein